MERSSLSQFDRIFSAQEFGQQVCSVQFFVTPQSVTSNAIESYQESREPRMPIHHEVCSYIRNFKTRIRRSENKIAENDSVHQ